MTTYPDLLPPNSTRFERSLAGPTGRLDNDIPVPIDRLLNADTCPTGYLPWLAWHLSLDLWDWQWSESKRRSVIRKAIELARAKGTAKGIRMAVEIMDGKVTQFLTPPQGFFASDELSKEDWDAWLHQMPELRIKLGEGHGIAYGDEFFADDDPPSSTTSFSDYSWQVYYEDSGVIIFDSEYATEDEANAYAETLSIEFVFVAYSVSVAPMPPPTRPAAGTSDGVADIGWVGEDDGWVLHGRRVILRQNGVDVPLQQVSRETYTENGVVYNVERISIPGTATMAFFADEDCEGYATEHDEVDAKVVTLRLDHTYNHVTSVLGLTMVPPSLKPQDPRYERESDIGEIGCDFYADYGVATFDSGQVSSPPIDYYDFASVDRGDDMLADRIFLLDPAVTTPMSMSISFADVDRVGWPAYHADIMVDLQKKEIGPAWFADDSTVDDGYSIAEDPDPIDRICRAVVVTKSYRDKIGLTFNPTRAAEPQDILTETMTVDERMPNSL